MCLGLTTDTEGNVIDMIWGHGGKLVEADDKTVALNSPGTVQAVKLIADMYLKHKIIPKGAISWDNQGNNKALSVASGDFRRELQQHLCPHSGVGQRAVRGDRDAPHAGRPGRCRSNGSVRGSGSSSSTTPTPRSPKDWSSTAWSRKICGW